MCETGLPEIGLSNDESILFYQEFKEKLHKQFMSKWESSILDTNVNPILRTYVTFKSMFKLESYLFNINDFYLRKCIAKFRMSSHSLKIETGRHNSPKIPLHLRTCTKCSTGEIEDEFHFLIKCPINKTIRNALYNKTSTLYCDFPVKNDYDKFIFLMKSNNISVNNWLAKAIKLMFELRDLSA